MNWTIIGLASFLLLGCAAPQAVAPQPVVIEKTKVVDTSCDWVEPIYIDSANDVLTLETASEILKHNRAGAAHCGWKPKVKPK